VAGPGDVALSVPGVTLEEDKVHTILAMALQLLEPSPSSVASPLARQEFRTARPPTRTPAKVKTEQPEVGYAGPDPGSHCISRYRSRMI